MVPAPTQGQVNLTVFLGSELVLRIPRTTRAAESRSKEAEVIPLVQDAGVPTPELVSYDSTLRVGSVPYMVLQRVHGATLADQAPDPSGRRRVLGSLGEILVTHRLLEPGPATLGPLIGSPVIPPGAQRRAVLRCHRRRPEQRRSGLIDGLVDALVTQPHRRLVRMVQSKVPADLLRAPPLLQQICHQVSELEVGVEATPMSACSARGRLTVRIKRPISAACMGVPAQFTRDRRQCPAQTVGDLTDTRTRPMQIRDLDPLFLR